MLENVNDMQEANITLWTHSLCSTRILPDRKAPPLPSDEHIAEKCETKATIPRSTNWGFKHQVELRQHHANAKQSSLKGIGSAFLWGICECWMTCAWTRRRHKQQEMGLVVQNWPLFHGKKYSVSVLDCYQDKKKGPAAIRRNILERKTFWLTACVVCIF